MDKKRTIELPRGMLADRLLGLLALSAPKPRESKNHLKRVHRGEWVPPSPVRTKKIGQVQGDAIALARRNRELNHSRPRSRKLCVNVKKLRRQLRETPAAIDQNTQYASEAAA